MIEFQNVAKTFKFGDREVNAVKDVSLSIQQGEILELLDLVVQERAHYCGL